MFIVTISKIYGELTNEQIDITHTEIRVWHSAKIDKDPWGLFVFFLILLFKYTKNV